MSGWPDRWAPILSLRLPEPVDPEVLASIDEASDRRAPMLAHFGDWVLPIIRAVGRDPYHLRVATDQIDLIWHTHTKEEADALADDAAQSAHVLGYEPADAMPPSRREGDA